MRIKNIKKISNTNTKPIALALLSVSLLVNWTSQPDKQGAQFFGTLTTRPGNTFCVHNITIGSDKKTKEIPVYEKPKNTTVFNRVDEHNYALSVDPKNSLATIYLNLDTIAQISVPSSNNQNNGHNTGHIVWTYKSDKGYRQYSYIEIEITSSIPEPRRDTALLPDMPDNKQKTNYASPNRYLIEHDTYIMCTRIDGKVPEKMKIQLPAVKYLTIEGYVSEREQDQSTRQPARQPTCQPTTQSLALSASPSKLPLLSSSRSKHKQSLRKSKRQTRTQVS